MRFLTLLIAIFSHSLLATDLAILDKNNFIVNNPKSVSVDKKTPNVHPISNFHVNRIVTPFKRPSIMMDSVQGIAHKQKGNVIYLSTTTSRRIAAFIAETGNESEAISVVLIPKKIPPQEIVIGERFSTGSVVAKNFEKSQPRINTIKEVLAILAKGDMPTGYIAQNVNSQYLPGCKQSGLSFDFYSGQLISGGHYLVSIGVVQNTSSGVIELKENNCHAKNVVAVAAYPATTLLPNERSEVFVMYNRERKYTADTPRKSLLDKE
ncbi:TraK domain-containing protein [Psychromonas aquimarina]|uniref:TraK domain-containing protein n=1 Tax=Psychromonas aquimarina TaxID=444919 RepID=UPI00041D1A80|nr:type-F conjugative transfer system secretin TraK [Psychromonas aquimarina]